MAVTTIRCDQCSQKFEVTYDGEWEDRWDAAWNNSCPSCGMVLCPKCTIQHQHRCPDQEDPGEEIDEPEENAHGFGSH